MSRKLPFIVGLVVVTVTGLAQGWWTGRWWTSRDLEMSVEKLAQVPMEVGDWRGSKLEMNERELKQAGIEGSLYRRYENVRTGAAVSVFLVSGKPGPISVHSPEVCYPGAGYVQRDERKETTIGDDRFWTIHLSKQTALAQSKIILSFGWTANGKWVAPTGDPRFTFVGAPVLYKMYIIQDALRDDADMSNNVGIEFANVFLDQLRQTLFQKSQG